MCLLSQIEYKHKIERDKQQRKELLEERRKAKYEKHFDICKKVEYFLFFHLVFALKLDLEQLRTFSSKS